MTNKKQSWLPNLLILLSIVGRLIPHPANATPVGAMALVGGAKLPKIWRWTTPFIALLLSDILLQLFFNTTAFSIETPFVYGSFAVSIFLGRFIQGNHRYFKLGTLSLVGSLQFFLLTNFGTWLGGLLYPPTLSGLAQCYTMALPYLSNTLVGDMAWSFGLFTVIEGAQVWLRRRTTDYGLGTIDLKA